MVLPVWILGANGRCGRAVAADLISRNVTPVLVGRNESELNKLAATFSTKPRVVIAASAEAIAKEIAKEKEPIVVVHTIGAFAETAPPIIRACAPGSHYVDICNSYFDVASLMKLRDEAIASGRCLVAGGGWGVTGTESVVLKLCENKPVPKKVRVDMLPAMVNEDEGVEVVGPTLAATLIAGVVAGTVKYENGKIVKASAGSDYEMITLPDGSKVGSGCAALGELESAHRGSGGAPNVISCSSFAPSSRMVRIMIPLLEGLLSWKPAANFAIRRLAAVKIPPSPKDARKNSYARAVVEWDDGTVKTGWLKTNDASVFTNGTFAEIAFRLANNQGRPGVFTPGALFGYQLALNVKETEFILQ